MSHGHGTKAISDPVLAGFAVPGALDTPTGGYGYARRLLREAPRRGLALAPIGLPDGFPLPTPEALAGTEHILGAQPPNRPILVDGLAWGALPLALIRTLPAPVVALCHHPLAMEEGLGPELAQHLRKTETAALGAASHVITTSHATAAILMRHFDVAPDHVTVAPPGTDPAPRGSGSPGSGCRILAVGSVTPRKQHDRLIRALAPHRDLDWTLRIVGPDRDIKTREALVELIAMEGLDDRVSLAGPLSIAALTAAYQQADLFALASGFEGFGMAFTEAMSHGLPVVGLNSPAVAEATAGAACLVGEATLSATLARLIARPEDRQVLSDRCWIAAQTLMRWPQTTTIIRDVLKKVTS